MNQTTTISEVKHIIAVASGKGGVGKSTVTANLAHSLASLGYKVGVLDADIYGPSQTFLMGTDQGPRGENGLIVPLVKEGIKFISIGCITSSEKPAIMRAPMAVKAIMQFVHGVLWGELDFLLVDLPPGTGDIQLSIAQQVKLSGIVIVTTPQKMASEIARKGLVMFQTLAVPILGVVENMSGFTCGHCQNVTAPFRKGGGRAIAENSEVPFLGEVPLDPQIMLSGDEGEDLQRNQSNSGPAVIFTNITKNLLTSLELSQQELGKNTPERIEIDGSIIRIFWKDNEQTEVDAFTLRTNCPCAFCVDEHTGQRIIRAEEVPLSIKALSAHLVGRYGLMVDFSDGHNKGIFKLSELRKLSPLIEHEL